MLLHLVTFNGAKFKKMALQTIRPFRTEPLSNGSLISLDFTCIDE